MWVAKTEQLDKRTLKITIDQGNRALSFADVFALCQNSAGFRHFLTTTLTTSPFPAIYWELPPLTTDTQSAAFECVVIDARPFTRMRPEPTAFANQFARLRAGQTVAAFSNLGGDARLISPVPISGNDADYPHLLAFLRSGQTEQINQFWQTVGREAEARMSHKPFWLSTAGLGVIWLHIRLDSRPKYYKFGAYRSADYLQ